MKLNVGSAVPKGQYKEKDWINIDDAPEGTFGYEANVLKISVLKMPWDWTDKFETIHCVHMLEHLNRNSRQEVLNELHRVAAPEGKLYLEVPDFQEIIYRLYSAYQRNDTERVHVWKTSIYGKQRYNGDSHQWGFDAEHLIELAKKAGFQSAVCWTNLQPDKMISSHYRKEPIILLEATK